MTPQMTAPSIRRQIDPADWEKGPTPQAQGSSAISVNLSELVHSYMFDWQLRLEVAYVRQSPRVLDGYISALKRVVLIPNFKGEKKNDM